ncbi:MAG TPA: hypothetical protein VJB65_01710 [Patescibacteria group bacterium]|nr:hypothetical protein [Patescibacteria group bacterium]
MRKILSISFLSVILTFFAVPTYAVCPVCTVAVGAGVGLSRWLGIDDTIAGIWIGGLTISLIMWTINWFNKKKIHFTGRNPLTVLGYIVLIVVPLYYIDMIGLPHNTLLGLDKLLLGIILGGVLFLMNALAYNYLKRRNNGHAYFPFQKVVMPVGSLAILSMIFYFVTK